MTLRTALLPVADTIRALAGPTKLDIRIYTVVVNTRTWSSGEVRVGTYVDSALTISPLPKVRVVPGTRDLLVGPFTPQYSTPTSGGYTPAQLNPVDVPGVEFYWIITGPDTVARPYVPVLLDETHPFSLTVRVTPLDRKVPF